MKQTTKIHSKRFLNFFKQNSSKKRTQNSQKLIPCRVMCVVVNLEFFNDKLATTGSAWKIFYFPCHAYLTYSNCDSLSCSKTAPQCTALLKFICAFTRFVNIQVVWSRTVLFIRLTYHFIKLQYLNF